MRRNPLLMFLLVAGLAIPVVLAQTAKAQTASSDSQVTAQLDQARKALAEQAVLLAKMQAELNRQSAALARQEEKIEQLSKQNNGARFSASDQDAANLQRALQKLRGSQPPVMQEAAAATARRAAASTAHGNTVTAAEKPTAVLPAITPIRALPIGVSRPASSALTVKAGSVTVTPYGLLKATAIEDSSSPNGDDFPLPGFLSDTGPDGSPEFHLKARSSRLGLSFAWNDANPKLLLTGKLEMDFEGNFNRSDNRNISTVRSSNPSLRLAWMRMDYAAGSKNVITALFGQDWSPFGSTTLPNMLETTSYGIGYGTLYERTPQMRFGYTHKFNGFSLMPEFTLALPAVGLTPAAAYISQQLGYGERQGADSNRPDFEGRLVAQWQLDHAAGVAPAQLIVSGEHGSRTAIVLASAVPSAYQKSFARGATVSSNTNGWDVEAQLPTRYATLIGKFYGGADLRYFFVNQLYSYYTDTAGLTGLASAASVDGASTVYFGTNAAGQQVVAPERPIRTAGGFAQLGLPLSRIFHARPGGPNAGWSLYALYGIDQAKTRDLNRLGTSSRRASTMAVGTLNYSLNRWVTFSFEQSLYTTHANPEMALPTFKGGPAREWNDLREEFGPVFTF